MWQQFHSADSSRSHTWNTSQRIHSAVSPNGIAPSVTKSCGDNTALHDDGQNRKKWHVCRICHPLFCSFWRAYEKGSFLFQQDVLLFPAALHSAGWSGWWFWWRGTGPKCHGTCEDVTSLCPLESLESWHQCGEPSIEGVLLNHPLIYRDIPQPLPASPFSRALKKGVKKAMIRKTQKLNSQFSGLQLFVHDQWLLITLSRLSTFQTALLSCCQVILHWSLDIYVSQWRRELNDQTSCCVPPWQKHPARFTKKGQTYINILIIKSNHLWLLNVQKHLLFRSLPTTQQRNQRIPAILLRSHANRASRLTSAGSGVATQKGAVVLHIYGQKTSENKEQSFRVGISHFFGGWG